MKNIWGLPIILLAVNIPAKGLAQSQQQYEKLSRWASYSRVTLTVCGELGMTIAPSSPSQIDMAIDAEAASWDISKTVFLEAKRTAFRREARTQVIDLERVTVSMGTPEGPQKLRAEFLRDGAICLKAAADPLFSRFVEVPVGFDLQLAATLAADKELEDDGFASWQTPIIQARGDLMAVAAACRKHIGPERSDSLFEKYSYSDDPRQRKFYVKSFDYGLSSHDLQNIDATQCERAIQRFKKLADGQG